MKTVLISCPNYKDATSWYRAVGPLAHLKKFYIDDDELRIKELPALPPEMPDTVGMTMMTEYNWASVSFADLLFIQRPFSKAHKHIIEICKQQGLPIWIDYDDDLFCVPTCNPFYGKYSKPDTIKDMAAMITMADVITVSTKALQRRIEDVISLALKAGVKVPEVVHVPNALNHHLFPYRVKEAPKRLPMIAWRGSSTHVKDVMAYAPAIIETSKKYEKWTWRFMGDICWPATDYMEPNKVFWSEGIDPMEYQQHFYDTAPAALMVPLYNDAFNQAKSKIAWIEAAVAGSAAIVPDWEEWDVDNALKYKDMDSFRGHLEDVITGKVDAHYYGHAAWQEVLKKHTLDKVNKLRYDILKKFL